MGLDMRPMGKPQPGSEDRFIEIFAMLRDDKVPKPTFIDRLMGRSHLVPTRDRLMLEWFEIQISSLETIRAPRVGRDVEADDWVKARYNELSQKPTFDKFMLDHEGYYVVELAKEQDGVPVYISPAQDENVFRGQFLKDCTDLIGEELVNEAWSTKLAAETLNYGERLMAVADKLGKENNLEHLKDQRTPPHADEDSTESKLHIVYSLARWLIFYGKHGHGYEADY